MIAIAFKKYSKIIQIVAFKQIVNDFTSFQTDFLLEQILEQFRLDQLHSNT